MSAYERAWDAFRGVVDDVELDRLLRGVEHETAHGCAERLRNIHGTDEGSDWNWWDAATIPGNCADLIDPEVSDR